VIRLLIADDHPVVRDGLRGMVASEPDLEMVGEAGDGLEALALVPRVRPDVALVDLRMPALDGVAAIEAGATGYLLKDAPRAELFRAVRAAARGETVLAPEVATRLVGQLREPTAQPLTQRELQVLELVARGATNREVAGRLQVSEATVKTHLVHAFGKLGVSDRTAAVTTALERRLIRLDG
jgi:DNA-binding NarL/FixJ family response regulator